MLHENVSIWLVTCRVLIGTFHLKHIGFTAGATAGSGRDRSYLEPQLLFAVIKKKKIKASVTCKNGGTESQSSI